MKTFLRRAFHALGLEVSRYRKPMSADRYPHDVPEDIRKIIDTVRPFTMTSTERLIALIDAVTYIHNNNIAGDIAECGVWRGGSTAAVAMRLLQLGSRSRNLFLYDTYSGMSDPTPIDRNIDGRTAREELDSAPKNSGVWCYATIEDVRRTLQRTGYPDDRIHYIRGKVEETIPAVVPEGLALLRLDTDWYESTRHELQYLFPRLTPDGVLILDDYGHWEGARRATDEYFALIGISPYLHRIDYTGRLVIKGRV